MIWRRRWTLSCEYTGTADANTFVLFSFDKKDGQVYMHRVWYNRIPRWLVWLIEWGFVTAVSEK